MPKIPQNPISSGNVIISLENANRIVIRENPNTPGRHWILEGEGKHSLMLINDLQCVDLGLDLETMKSLMDDEEDNLELEVDRLNKELKSVETSLKILKNENAQL